jgi:hypothetical protein
MIPSSVEFLGSSCFSNCKSLSSITFESNSHLTRIESSAFSFSSLQSIGIQSSVEILCSSCFSNCRSLSSISFEAYSRLTRIESYAFSGSSLQSIVIPRSVEILGPSCFSNCKLLSSITFESNSRLIRIESSAFSYSELQSILIPRSVQFIDGSAFVDLSLFAISLEAENDKFVLENGFLIDIIHHKLIRNFSTSLTVQIANSIEILGSCCFSKYELLSSITFESNSRSTFESYSHLTRIEPEEFYGSLLQSIIDSKQC